MWDRVLQHCLYGPEFDGIYVCAIIVEIQASTNKRSLLKYEVSTIKALEIR
jgi:hypothetical protein